MTEIDTYVQTCLNDHGISPWRRAKMAAKAIESHVRADVGYDGPLEVPLEWQHRIPQETHEVILSTRDAGVVKEIARGTIPHLALDPEPWVHHRDDTEPVILDADDDVLEGEVVSEEEQAAMREAFNAEWDRVDNEDDQVADEKFNAFWWRGRK